MTLELRGATTALQGISTVEDASGPEATLPPTKPEPPRRRMARVPALDGLRGLAVLSVIAFHAELGWARGGFLGVDAFFVLSGYLITSLLRTEHAATGSVSLRSFWTGRGRRLFPALGLVFVAILAFAAFRPEQPSLTALRDDMFAGIGYVANWRYVISGADYFSAAAPSPLRHLWSLAIEEQFYLVWPLVFLVLARVRHAALAVLLCAVASATLMLVLYHPGGDPSRVYYGTDTHAHGLLLGALLAFLPIRASRWLSAAGLVALLGAISCGFWLEGSSSGVYTGGLLAFEVLVAIVVAACVQPRASSVRSVLSFRPLRAIGLVSYGLYLWHWPIFVLVDRGLIGLTGNQLLAVQLLLTIVLALLSYFLVEMPIRNGLVTGRRAVIFLPVLGAGLVAAILLVSASLDSPIVAASRSKGRNASLSPEHPGRTRVMLVGDSTAFSLAPGLATSAERAGMEFVSGADPGCALDWRASAVKHGDSWMAFERRPRCDWSRSWPRLLERYRPDLVVVLFGPNDVGDHRVGDRLYPYGSGRWYRHMAERLTSAVGVIRHGGAEVAVLLNPGLFIQPGVAPLNQLYATTAARLGVSVFDLGPVVSAAGTEYRWDGIHFTGDGALATGTSIVDWIERGRVP